MVLPLERSVEEAHLYMAMRPCEVCGESEFECQSSVVLVDGDLASRYDGPCAGCGTNREFLFRLPETVSLPAVELRFGGPEPSELLDAGEWFWVAGNFASYEPAADGTGSAADAGEPAAGGTGPNPDELTADELAELRADLAGAAAAIDEVLKFIPEGAVEPPDEAFWSDRGRQARAERPEEFHRDRLEARRDHYRHVLATLSAGGS